MRIIGGIHRSHPLHAPPDALTTRPITDRVKENLFNRLMAMGQLGGGNVVDIFAGTGSMGLEALSRGADHCTFVEANRKIRQLLERNLDDLKLREQAKVLDIDAFVAAWDIVLPQRPIDLVFCDPPYRFTNNEADMARVVAMVERLSPLLDPEAMVVLRTEKQVAAPGIEGLQHVSDTVDGSMRLVFFAVQER